ncbi:hypothetical protein HDU77_001917 [Chytriomyces hyalinus]|nr:hypothetical protein HDU77_001917 [Chytriomyces hyalinus]
MLRSAMRPSLGVYRTAMLPVMGPLSKSTHLAHSITSFKALQTLQRSTSNTVQRHAFSSSAACADTAKDSEIMAKFAAFSARSGITLSHPSLLAALTHKSYRPVSADNSVSEESRAASQRNRILGAKLLEFHVLNYVMLKFPVMPAHGVESLVDSYVGDKALVSVGRNLGVPSIMRWKKSDTLEEGAAGLPGQVIVVARVIQALVGAIYQEKGAKGVDSFVKTHILSRTVDVGAHLKLQINPKGTLRQILADAKREAPVSRLLKETGRLSTSPVFIVGVYSGIEKLGEGYGSSMAMAETRACKNALERYFTKEIKDVKVPLDGLSEEKLMFEEKVAGAVKADGKDAATN